MLKTDLILEELKKGVSVNTIKARHGVSGVYVYQIAKKHNIPTGKGLNYLEPISTTHLSIAQKIIARRILDLNLDSTQAAVRCNIPIIRFSKIEAGIFDLTLTDLLKIQKGLEIQILKD